MTVRFGRGAQVGNKHKLENTEDLDGTEGTKPSASDDGAAAAVGGDSASQTTDTEAMAKPSKVARAALGQTSQVGRRKKSAGSRAATTGLEKTGAGEEASRRPSKFKQVVLATMIGITALNAASPALADPIDVNPVPDTEVTMQLSAEQLQQQGMSPFSLRLSETSGNFEMEPPGGDGIKLEIPADILDGDARLSQDVQNGVDRALERFEDRAERILNRDAASLARGESPVFDGDQLTSNQQDQMLDAMVDMLKDMPAGALSDSVTAPLLNLLQQNGVDTSDFDTTKIGDLGDYGSDLAKNLIDDLKENNPKAYYSLAGVAAGAVGAVGYFGGSDALDDLGIKPEISTKVFDDRLEVSLSPEWDARFQNATGNLDLTYDMGRHDVTVGGQYDGDSFNPRLGYRFDGDTLDARANLTYDTTDGSVEAEGRLNYRPTDDFRLSARGNIDHDGDGSINLSSRYDINDRLNLRGNAGYRFGDNEGASGSLSLGYEPSDRVQLELTGGHNPDDGAFAGIGLKITF